MTKLFSQDFSQTNSEKVLDSYVKNYPKLDPSYIVASCSKDRLQVKKWLESLWCKYEPYAEPGFLKRLRSKHNNGFHTFSWQMYLASVLMDNGYKLIPNDGTGPDIQIDDDGKNIWIEATVTTPGNDPNASEAMESGDIYSSINPRIARITNSFTKKYKDYEKKYLGKLCKEDEVYIIAINGQQTDTQFKSRAIESALYARGNDSISIPNKRGTSKLAYELKESITIVKDGKDIKIPTNYFCSDEYSKVSAVIYCETHIINASNYGRNPEEELFFAVNNFANNEIDGFTIGNVIERTEEGAIRRI